ncbi:hypothetical protein P691DRAFT_774904 [Macrolepiota fuliginosa MF-IS2]|uniref:Uncharacterized protein n=1 Tax=Macrolepiota fuliginosa MF-IS2 TaxID=1400762 RepID=A0A9P5XGI5_9AGAR|nr:hypothetical protein P691DRAFT_774904 [Macrolepiota fuliginosa MF-IS2]
MTTTALPIFDTTGYVQFKNAKFDIHVGRSPDEDSSIGPKTLFALKPAEVGKNALFYFEVGLDGTQWELQSLGSVVTKADNPVVPGEAPVPRPVALVGDNATRFKWKTGDAQVTTIEDIESGLVWTLCKGFEGNMPGFVTLEKRRSDDESQLWKFEFQA